MAGLVLLGGCASAPTQSTLAQAQEARSLAPLLPMRRFVANIERTGGFVLSPDGLRLLWSQTVGTDVGLAVRPVADAQAVSTFATGNQGRGGGYYNWLPDSRHVVFSKDERGDENTQLRVFDAQAPDLSLWQLTPARGVRAWVVGRGAAGSARFFFASNERDRSTFDLYEADASTRQVTEVARSDGSVLAWLVGTDARPAGRIRQLGRQDGADTVLELREASGGWRVLKTWGGFDFINVLRIDPAQGRLWALSNLGRDKLALVEVDTASGAERVLAEHAVVDVAQSSFASAGGPPVGYVVEPDHPQMHFFDATWKAQVDAVVARAVAQGSLPAAPVFTRLQGRDDTARRVVLRSLGPFDAAELLWDRETGAVSRLDTYFPEEAQVLSPVTPMAFTASDGRRIHGYLTRPRGVSGPVPLVADIHGGPWARDTWAPATFNARQMLANRGYAVLQLNYRGSTGYGREHMWAGAMAYNGRLQQDIAEGVQWAIDQGVADPRRLAVMGASFGGFSVLAQLAQKRHDYRCGINVVGVADWPRVIENWPPFWRNRHMFVRFYGDPADPAQRAEMLRNSPVSYLDQITAPLLVVHGANDIRVLRQDSDDVVAALRQRGQPVDYLLFPDEGHSISKWRNRLALWRTVEDTLATCLGGRSAGFDFYELMPRGR
jgi:dipeptidyl aminopeptidase/acylaminoacyl peptidase